MAARKSARIAAQNANPAKKGALRLALRLTKGVRNATDDALEAAVSICEGFALFFGAAVVVGVVAEIWFTAPGGALVAIGVAGELLFSFRGTALQNELTRRAKLEVADAKQQAASALGLAAGAAQEAADAHAAAEEATNNLAVAQGLAAQANERAANAERETARLKADFGWRALTEDQKSRLREGLKKSPGTVNIRHLTGDTEGNWFAWDIIAEFSKAGWEAYLSSGVTRIALLDTRIMPVDLPGSEALAETVRQAFSASSIPFNPAPFWPNFTDAAGEVASRSEPTVWVYIGPKRMPASA